MKINQRAILSDSLTAQIRTLGALVARLRIARGLKQDEVALRAGISRNTAYRLEKGDPGLAIGQIVRYVDAIAPGKTLSELLNESDPALAALRAKEQRRRASGMSKEQLEELDF